MLVKTLLLAALGVVSTTAQLTNSTLLSILNTTQLSPSSKFVQLLESSPDYQPILQLLSQPGNLTLFVPSDAVFDRLIQEFNETQQQQSQPGSSGSGSNGTGTGTETSTQTGTETSTQTGTGTGVGTGSANQPGSTSAAMSINSDADASNGTMSGGGGGGSQQQGAFPQDFTIFGNFSVADILYYHIVQEVVFLQNDTNQTTILNSMLTNQTADKFGYGLPLILNTNATSSSPPQGNGGGGAGGEGGNATQSGTTSSLAPPTTQTTGMTSAPQTQPTETQGGGGGGGFPGQGGLTPEMGSWISRLKQLMMAPETTSSTNNASQTPVYWIGNGLSYANVTMHDIVASNGILHVIDNVLIPPGNASNVFANISTASALSEMIEENPQVTQALNNATNVTIFAPNDKGLCMVCIDQLGQDKWTGLVMNHVVPGVYYTTNLTGSSGGTAPTTLTTEAGESIPVSSNSSGITLNNTINIVTPNILFNGGVIHLIDKIIAPPTNTTVSNNGTAAGPSTETSAPPATATAPTSTESPLVSAIESPQAQATEPSTTSSETSTEANPIDMNDSDTLDQHPRYDDPLPPTSL